MTRGLSNPVVNGYKYCPKCRNTKPVEEFYRANHTEQGVRSPCKQCNKDGSKDRYEMENSYGKTRNAIVVEERTRIKQELVDALGGGCLRCGYNKSINALDFHHVGKGKEANITKMITAAAHSKKNVSALLLEVSKCVLLCSNCHRELHSGDWEL